LHVRDTPAYSMPKRLLCLVCHNKPDQSQEDFDRCCNSPDNAFLCENKRASSQSKNIRTKKIYQHCFLCPRGVLPRSNNHRVDSALQKLKRRMYLLSFYPGQPEESNQLMGKYRTVLKTYQDLSCFRPSVISIDQK